MLPCNWTDTSRPTESSAVAVIDLTEIAWRSAAFRPGVRTAALYACLTIPALAGAAHSAANVATASISSRATFPSALMAHDRSNIRLDGTSVLGAAMAAALTQAGARVMVTGRDQSRAQAAADGLGPLATPWQLDVRDERSVAACVAGAREAWGGIDMLVNNAGIGMRTVNPRFMSAPQPFGGVPPAGFRDVVETKVVRGPLMARDVAPLLLAGGGGRIVNRPMNEETRV